LRTLRFHRVRRSENIENPDKSRMMERRKEESKGETIVALEMLGVVQNQVPNAPVAFITKKQQFGRYFANDEDKVES
jgi:hypothetical protein